MNERERVRHSLAFGRRGPGQGVAPWQIDFTSEIGTKLMKAFGLKEEVRAVRGKNVFFFNELQDFFGSHLWYIRSEAVDSLREAGPGVWVDEWGVKWDRSVDKDIGVPVNTAFEGYDLSKLRIPDPDDPARFEHIAPLLEASRDRYRIVKISRCLFEKAWSLVGMERFMVDLLENPDFVHEYLDRLADFALRLVKNLASFPIDGIRFSDDWAGQRGLLMSPKMWREFLRPRLKRMYDQAHRQGYGVFIHCCGDVTPLLDDLVEIGVDVFNPLQPEVMDVEKTVAAYAGRLAFYGGLSIQKTLPFGTPMDVEDEVRHRLGVAGEHGGFLLAPSHDMTPDIPVKNVEAMLGVLKGQ